MIVRLLIRALLLLGLFTAGEGEVMGADAGAPSEILLGMSTALSGPAADLGKDMLQGVVAALERANRVGGVKGRRLRLITLDDGYEPARTAPNMHQLLEKENVLAVIGNVGTPTAIVALPIANAQKTLFFAPFTGAGMLRKNPPDHCVINYRASYAEETGAMIDALIDGTSLKCEDIAFFTQHDGYGDAGFDGGLQALKRHGLKDEQQVLHVSYERNTLAVEDALATLLYAKHEPRVIVMVGAYRPCARFIKLAHEAGLKMVFLNVSFVGSNPLALELGQLPARVLVTQVVPHPLAVDVPIVREYRADLQALDPSIIPGFGTLEGYIAARILIRALETIPGPPTREGIVDALDGLGKFDLGLGEPLQLGPNDHQACHRIWPTILRDGKFVQFPWSGVAALLEEQAKP
jgi:branched-chain amino acid transport system substrate-binding protein